MNVQHNAAALLLAAYGVHRLYYGSTLKIVLARLSTGKETKYFAAFSIGQNIEGHDHGHTGTFQEG